MTIKLKIILITILGLFFTIGVLGTISVKQAEEILTKKGYDALVSQRDSKSQRLKKYFDERLIDMKVLVESLDAKELAEVLSDSHDKDNKKHTISFHVPDTKVEDKIFKHDIFFQNYIKEYAYRNLLLIDNHDGHILYSAVKDVDYGQNTSKGLLQNKSLSGIWRKVIKLQRATFSDMELYNQNDKSLAMFLGAPVYVDGEVKAIMVFHIPSDDINYIMKFRKGYGDTQEDYLVGEDNLMRSDSQLDMQTHSLMASYLNKSAGFVDTAASRAALSGESDIKPTKDYRGVSVLSAYAPIKIGEDLTWAIISEIDEKEVMIPVIAVRNKIFIISIILLLGISSIIYFVINKIIILPLNNFQNGLLGFFQYLNRQSSEVEPLYAKSNDEIGDMARVVNTNISNTKTLILNERELYKHELELTEDLKKLIYENNKYTWVKDGISILHEKLSGDLCMSEVSRIAIDHLCNYLHAGVGVLYLFDEDKKLLTISSSFAYVRNEGDSKSFKLGEGTVGQAGEQKAPILLKNMQLSNLRVDTGMSSGQPLNIYTFPLIFKDELCGVVEVGYSEEFDETSREFFESSNLVIATALATAKQNEKVKDLLEDVKLSNTRLQHQQQKLEESNAQMEEQRQQLEESNAQMEEHRQQLQEQNDSLIKSQNLLDQRARDLAQSNKYKSEFLANMSHELRTPLNSIILLSDMLQENQNNHLDKDEIKKARVINNSGNDLLRLIGDVLDLSKIEAGKMELIIEKFDSRTLCEDFQLQFEDMAQQKLLEFKTIDEYRGEISNDKGRVFQVLRNLISNALKFTKEGSVTLKVQSSGEMVNISIIDTGIGIAQDKQESIFEAFKQADGTTSREYGGTGLGLSISLELVKMMHGEISLKSTKNRGSIFTISIPNIDESANVIEQYSEVEMAADADDDRDILKADDKPFLIIEDDEVFANILKDKVNMQDEYALIAHSGKSGISLAREYDVKGVLLDLGLPDIDGIDVLKEFKTDSKLRSIPVYVISGDQRVEITREYGANGFVKKPISENEIAGVIDNIKTMSEEIDVFVNRTNNGAPNKSNDTVLLKGKKILVVDDDIRNIYVLMEALGSRGAEIISAGNGQEAIEILSKNLDTDIILMDIMMPVMDGYEAAGIIKKNSKTKEIPIIAVTAKAMSDDRDKALESGFDDYITKPLQMSILSTIIEAWIKKQ